MKAETDDLEKTRDILISKGTEFHETMNDLGILQKEFNEKIKEVLANVYPPYVNFIKEFCRDWATRMSECVIRSISLSDEVIISRKLIEALEDRQSQAKTAEEVFDENQTPDHEEDVITESNIIEAEENDESDDEEIEPPEKKPKQASKVQLMKQHAEMTGLDPEIEAARPKMRKLTPKEIEERKKKYDD